MALVSREYPRRLSPSGHWIPWLFAAGMLLVVLVNGALIYFALSTWSGVSTTRAYERGIAYNQVLSAAARQEELGWAFEAAYQVDGAGTGLGRLVLDWRDRGGRGLSDLNVRIALVRPLETGSGIELAARPEGGGRYVGVLEALRAGQWDLRVSARRGGEAVHVTRRLVVQ